MPATVNLNDVLYLVVSHDSATTTTNFTDPSGWVREGDIWGSGCALFLWSRRADGSEGGTTQNVFLNAGRYMNGVSLRITGVDPSVTDLTHQYTELVDTGITTGHTSPPITTTVNDCLVMSAFATDDITGADNVSPVGAEVEMFDFMNPGFNTMVLAGYRTNAASPGTYDHDVTFSPSPMNCLSIMWAINAGSPVGSGSGSNRMMMGA